MGFKEFGLARLCMCNGLTVLFVVSELGQCRRGWFGVRRAAHYLATGRSAELTQHVSICIPKSTLNPKKLRDQAPDKGSRDAGKGLCHGAL